jgi:anti-sigma B factor antagonist
MGGLDIQTLEKDGISVVALAGNVDTTSADQLRKQVAPLCAKDGARVLLDCSNLGYLNSSCIGQLNDFHRMCSTQDGKFAVCCLDRSVIEIMDLLGLKDILNLASTRQEGISMLMS